MSLNIYIPDNPPKFRDLSLEQQMKMRESFEYPPFRKLELHDSIRSTSVQCIRPNRVLIRPYHPTGYRPSGLWVSRNDKHPALLGHIVGIAAGLNRYTAFQLELGDNIMFHRFADEVLEEVELQEPLFDGEKAPIAVLHVGSIQAVFRPELTPMRV